MRRSSSFVLILVLGLPLACGGKRNGDLPPQEPSGEMVPPATEKPQEGEVMQIEGVLKPTVEKGGWVVETGTETYLLISIADFVTQPWFKEGSRIRVSGQPDPEVMTTFMQGTPFRVESIEPLEGPGGGS